MGSDALKWADMMEDDAPIIFISRYQTAETQTSGIVLFLDPYWTPPWLGTLCDFNKPELPRSSIGKVLCAHVSGFSGYIMLLHWLSLGCASEALRTHGLHVALIGQNAACTKKTKIRGKK